MNARDRREVDSFFNKVRERIQRETALATAPGIRPSARRSAARRALQFSADLDYLRALYSRQVVMVGQGSAQ